MGTLGISSDGGDCLHQYTRGRWLKIFSLRDGETGWPVKCCMRKWEPEFDPQHSCGKASCGGTLF